MINIQKATQIIKDYITHNTDYEFKSVIETRNLFGNLIIPVKCYKIKFINEHFTKTFILDNEGNILKILEGKQ